MRGVYLAAAELSRLGFTVSVTARNSAGADLLVFDPDSASASSIDVKTNATRANFWLVGENAGKHSSPTHFFLFLNISASAVGGESYEYYLVPSSVVASDTVIETASTGSRWFSFKVHRAEQYRDAWWQLQRA
jgi:hypothetical protein